MTDEPTIIPIVVDAATRVTDEGSLQIKLSTIGGSITLELDTLLLGEHGEQEFHNKMHGINIMVNCFAEEWVELVKTAIQLHFEDLK